VPKKKLYNAKSHVLPVFNLAMTKEYKKHIQLGCACWIKLKVTDKSQVQEA